MADGDWYPHSSAGERLMYGNIEEKIDAYAPKYPFLTVELLAKVHAMCGTFIEVYDKIEYNRATGRQATAWFNNIVASKQDNTPASAPPVFMPMFCPSGRLRGSRRLAASFAGFRKSSLIKAWRTGVF